MTLTTQFYTMLAMIGMGVSFGATLDTYGRFLKRPKRSRWLVFINDILFWLMEGLITFLILLMVNKGELRFYIFVALLCGYAAYQSLLRVYYNRLLEYVIHSVITISQFLAKTFNFVVIKPIRLLIKFLIYLIIGLWGVIFVLLRFLLKLFTIILKILFTPVKWVFTLLLKLIPMKYKFIFHKFFKNIAGVFQKIKNIKNIIVNWWRNRRKP